MALEQSEEQGTGGSEPSGFRGKALNWAVKKRRALIAIAIITGLLGFVFAILIGFLAAFKLIFMKENTDRVRLARMTHILDSRSDRFVNNLIAAEVAGEQDGKNRYFVAKGWNREHPYYSFYEKITGKEIGGERRINKFFDQIEKDKGYRFVRETGGIGSRDRLVRLEMNGQTIDFSGLSDRGGLANLDELVAERFETNKLARGAWKDTVKKNTRFYNIVKRYNMRKWGYEKLGITKWRFFEGTRENAERKVRTRWTRAVMAKHMDGSLIRCLLQNQCPSSSSLNDETNRVGAADPDLENARDEADTDANQAEAGDRANKFLDSFAGKAISRFIPFVNITENLDLLSSIHSAIGPNGGLVKAVAATKAAEAIYSYFGQAIITDHLKAGEKADGAEVNAVMGMYDGIEKSEAYNDVIGSPNTAFAPVGEAYAQNDTQLAKQDDLLIGSADTNAQKITTWYRVSGLSGKIGPVAAAWNAIPGIIKAPFRLASTLVGGAFGIILDLVSAATGGVLDVAEGVKWLLKQLFTFLGASSKCGGHESAGRLFTCQDAGASSLQEAFLESNGGHPISEQEHRKQQGVAYLEQGEEDRRRSMFSRFASLDGSNSVLANVLIKTPTNTRDVMARVNSVIASINPFGLTQLAYGFGSAGVNALPTAYAQSRDSNPYDVARRGLTEAELAKDPYGGKTKEECVTEAEAHNAKVSGGEPSDGSMCLMDDMVANGLTCYRSEDDICSTIQTSGDAVTETPTDPAIIVSGDAQELARAVLNSDAVTGDPRYMAQIADVARGDTGCNVNPTILKLLAGMVQKGYSYYISSLNRFCTGVLTASGTASYHYSDGGGHAVDFSIINGVASTGGTANDIRFLKDAAEFMPSDSGVGQVNCRAPLTLPAGISQFNDSCNHVHIQVPKAQAT